MIHASSVLLLGLALAVPLPALPSGGGGIASRHPGDVGIASDPDVLFHDDFETATDADSLRAKWDAAVHHDAHIRIATEPANVNRGSRAVEFKVPQQSSELANSISRSIQPERDVLHLRYYSKFEAGFDQTGSSHNGASISAHYFVNGNATPGVPANGTNKFLAAFECWRADTTTEKPGELNIYIYHPEQATNYGDHFFPSGKVLPFSYSRSGAATFGPEFVGRPDIIPVLDRWYCHEVMVKANTPGLRDGRIACWLDGVLIADFPNLRLRDIDTLKIDRAGIGLHIGSNTIRENRKYYDDVVIATSYIGPIAEGTEEEEGTGKSGGGGCSGGGGTSPLGLLAAMALMFRRVR